MKRNGIQHTLIWFDMANAKPNLHNIMKNLLLSPHSKLYWVKDVKHLLNSVENFEKMFKKKSKEQTSWITDLPSLYQNIHSM